VAGGDYRGHTCHGRDIAVPPGWATYNVTTVPKGSRAPDPPAVQRCASHWHVTAAGAVSTTRQHKVNVGASTLLRRDRRRADLAWPPVLVTNIAVPCLHAGKRSVYFLPDRILVRDGGHYADMPYSSCCVTGTTN
jgi:hypothetical protein